MILCLALLHFEYSSEIDTMCGCLTFCCYTKKKLRSMSIPVNQKKDWDDCSVSYYQPHDDIRKRKTHGEDASDLDLPHQ